MKTLDDVLRIECKLYDGSWHSVRMEQLEVGDIVRYQNSPDYPDNQELVITKAPLVGEEPTEPEPAIEYKCRVCGEPASDYNDMCINHENESQAFLREKYRKFKGWSIK